MIQFVTNVRGGRFSLQTDKRKATGKIFFFPPGITENKQMWTFTHAQQENNLNNKVEDATDSVLDING